MENEKLENLSLGISAEDLHNLYDYVAGKVSRPSFVDKYTADANCRMKDMLLVVNELRLSQIPQLLDYNNKICDVLYSKENIENMDVKDLTTSMLNINKNILTILETSIKTIQTINGFDGLDSKYRGILDKLIILSEEKLEQIEDILKD